MVESLNEIGLKVDKIYEKHRLELEKENIGDIVAIDWLNEKIVGIAKRENLVELVIKLKELKCKAALRRIGGQKAVFRFR
ncbi:MAG: hypothetical protein ACE5KT_09000 [Methanosarcinales archaeon]